MSPLPILLGGARGGAYGDLESARRYRAELPRKIAESVRLADAKPARARASFLEKVARRP